MAFANSLDPDQARLDVGPDLDPKLADALVVHHKEFFENVNFKYEKKSADDK